MNFLCGIQISILSYTAGMTNSEYIKNIQQREKKVSISQYKRMKCEVPIENQQYVEWKKNLIIYSMCTSKAFKVNLQVEWTIDNAMSNNIWYNRNKTT